MPGDLSILILAAGASSRMRGRDKLLERIDDVPQLRRITLAAVAVCDRVLVALRPVDVERRAVIADLPVTILPVAEASEGMSASIRAGAAIGSGALMILPADMPEITASLLERLIAHFDQINALRAAAEDGTPGHPVIFPARLRKMLLSLTGDQGARQVLQAEAGRVTALPLPGQAAVIDLDTPEEWATWRALRRPAEP